VLGVLQINVWHKRKEARCKTPSHPIKRLRNGSELPLGTV
jgi:hypothetical protein